MAVPGLDPGINPTIFSREFEVEVSPLRVHGLDQGDLPGARPVLDVLLTPDGIGHHAEGLIVDEADETVARGEAFNEAFAAFIGAAREIRCHADIEYSAWAIGHDVDVALTHRGMLNGEDARIKVRA